MNMDMNEHDILNLVIEKLEREIHSVITGDASLAENIQGNDALTVLLSMLCNHQGENSGITFPLLSDHYANIGIKEKKTVVKGTILLILVSQPTDNDA
jgi:hypothetical protein